MQAVAWFEGIAVLVGAGALLLSAAGTLHAARWARAPLAPASGWRPFATVIVPCKGAHQGFEANARALASQAYGEHEVLFVLDERGDPSAPALERLARGAPHVRVVLSEPEVVGDDWATGKIVAQLTGAGNAAPRSEVLVFADADARPPPGWLAALVAPLADPRVGGVTGYRWYAPASRATLWTALRDAWNAVGLDALTMRRFRFLWGGSMACRRADFERSDVRARWRTTVSEDVGLTRALEALDLDIAFAPGAMVASLEDWTRAEVVEWVVRQSALTRVAMPRLFRFAAGVYALSLGVFAAGLTLVAAWPSPLLGAAGLAMLAPLASAVPRAWLRERLVRRALGERVGRGAGQHALHLALSVAMPAVMLAALAAAARVEAIEWRGRRYALPRRARAPD